MLKSTCKISCKEMLHIVMYLHTHFYLIHYVLQYPRQIHAQSPGGGTQQYIGPLTTGKKTPTEKPALIASYKRMLINLNSPPHFK